MNQVEETVIEKLPEDKKSLRDEYVNETRLIEALLFASQRPLKLQDIQERLPGGVPVAELISELKNDYISKGVNLVNIAGGWTFRTADDLKDNLRSLVHGLNNNLLKGGFQRQQSKPSQLLHITSRSQEVILNPYGGWPLVKVPSTLCLNVTGYVRAVEGEFREDLFNGEQAKNF